MKGVGFFIILSLCIPLGIFGQTIVPKSTINAEVGLPVAIANQPFKGMMQGLVHISSHYQYTLDNTLSFGVGGMFSYFTINEFKVPFKITGGMKSVGGFVKIGQEKFHTQQFATDFGVKVGYAYTFFDTSENEKLNQNPMRVESSYICPTIGLVLAADEFTSYRLNISYVMQGFSFLPSHLGFTTNAGYDASKFNRITQFLSVGFGYTYYFKSR